MLSYSIEKKVVEAVIKSTLTSAGITMAIPLIIFMMLLFGIAGLPHAAFIFICVISATILIPGIIINIHLTNGILLKYRIFAIILYLITTFIVTSLLLKLSRGGLSSLGQF